MEAVGASLKTGFARQLCLFPFKLAALVLLMMAPAQAAMQHANCDPLPIGYGQQAGDDASLLVGLRLAAGPAIGAVAASGGDPALLARDETIERRVLSSGAAFDVDFLVTHAPENRTALASKRAPPHKV